MKILLTGTCAALLAVAFSGQALSQARPQIATTKVEGTEGVYIFRNGGHQSMFIVTKAGVIATDPVAYGRPTGGQTYVDEIKKVTNQPIKFLIYSHHHFDHIAGGKAFKDAGAHVVAHVNVRKNLAPLKDPNTVMPDEVFDGKKVISLGGTVLELHYLGKNHSDSTIVMRLPKEKIIFVVDTIPVGSFPGRGMIDIYPLETEEFMKKVIAMDWERLIPGHPGQPNDRLGTKDDAKAVLEIYQDASAEMKKLGQEGKCWDAAEKEFKLTKYEKLPGYENGLPFVARRYCGLWGRGT
jgi:glyoxylase-like metal-dependent hydrolase (beta-lactamase superfamily II)